MNLPTRNTILSTVALLAVAFAITTTSVAAEQPNIVYIIVDDAGYGDLSCYGQKLFQTPNIDRLASEGLKFTQHYSGSTVCAPSRCSLMTGLHTGHCYIRGNKEIRPIGQEPMPASITTVAELMKDAGYATGGFGKWGLGYPGSEGDPINQGFDTFFGYNCQRGAHSFYPSYLFHNEKKVPLDGKTYSHDLIMEQALKFIRENAKKPFFCFMPITIPHAAMHCPEDYVAPWRKKFPQFEDKIGRYSGPTVRNPVAAFAGMMTKLDDGVGELLDLLKELNLDDNTIVMFTSDNGPHVEGGHNSDFFDSNGPLRGKKRSLTEGGIRVPMLARWPGKIEAGTTTDHISAFWDVLPTLCELVGTDTPDGLDGISFVPTLMGKTDQANHEYLYWEFFEQGGKRAARMGKWKAVQRGVQKSADSPILLYDLDADLGEDNNIAGDHPEIIEQMKQIFKDAHTRSEIWRYPSLGEK